MSSGNVIQFRRPEPDPEPSYITHANTLLEFFGRQPRKREPTFGERANEILRLSGSVLSIQLDGDGNAIGINGLDEMRKQLDARRRDQEGA